MLLQIGFDEKVSECIFDQWNDIQKLCGSNVESETEVEHKKTCLLQFLEHDIKILLIWVSF